MPWAALRCSLERSTSAASAASATEPLRIPLAAFSASRRVTDWSSRSREMRPDLTAASTAP